METVLQVCLSNTIGALFVAVPAMLVGSTGRRPALAHFLWVLMLVKLLTPPLFHLPLGHHSRPAQARISGDAPHVGLAVDSRPVAARQSTSASERTLAGRAAPVAITSRSSMLAAQGRDLLGALATRVPSASYTLVFAAWLGMALCWWFWAAWRASQFCGLIGWASLAPTNVQDRAAELACRLGMRRRSGGLVCTRTNLADALDTGITAQAPLS